MEKAEHLFKMLADFLWGDWLLAALLGFGAFYKLITGCVQIKCVWLLKKGYFQFSRGKKEIRDEKNAPPIRPFVLQWQAVWEVVILWEYPQRFYQEVLVLYSGCGWLRFWEWPPSSGRSSWASNITVTTRKET